MDLVLPFASLRDALGGSRRQEIRKRAELCVLPSAGRYAGSYARSSVDNYVTARAARANGVENFFFFPRGIIPKELMNFSARKHKVSRSPRFPMKSTVARSTGKPA
jgi:hypothetical protein